MSVLGRTFSSRAMRVHLTVSSQPLSHSPCSTWLRELIQKPTILTLDWAHLLCLLWMPIFLVHALWRSNQLQIILGSVERLLHSHGITLADSSCRYNSVNGPRTPHHGHITSMASTEAMSGRGVQQLPDAHNTHNPAHYRAPTRARYPAIPSGDRVLAQPHISRHIVRHQGVDRSESRLRWRMAPENGSQQPSDYRPAHP
jgi:hypothetical protein